MRPMTLLLLVGCTEKDTETEPVEEEEVEAFVPTLISAG